MFRLNQTSPFFTETWFITIATVASIMLSTAFMAVTDSDNTVSARSWGRTATPTDQMVMVVRVPASHAPLSFSAAP